MIPDIKYFKDTIESSLCHVFVDRRVAELMGCDINEIDDFIEERCSTFQEALSHKSLLEMSEILRKLTNLSEQTVKELEELKLKGK